MRVLLDTHAFLWLVTDDPKLSATAKAVFLEDDNELLLISCSWVRRAPPQSMKVFGEGDARRNPTNGERWGYQILSIP